MAHFYPGGSCQDLNVLSNSGPQTEPQQMREVWCPSMGYNKHRSEFRGLQEWLGGFPTEELAFVHFLWEFELYIRDASVDLKQHISWSLHEFSFRGEVSWQNRCGHLGSREALLGAQKLLCWLSYLQWSVYLILYFKILCVYIPITKSYLVSFDNLGGKLKSRKGLMRKQPFTESSFPLTDGCIFQAQGSRGTNKLLFVLEELTSKCKKK